MTTNLPSILEFLSEIDEQKLNNAEDADDIWMLVEATLETKFPHVTYDYEPPEIIRKRVNFMKEITSMLCDTKFGPNWLDEHECKFFKTTQIVIQEQYHPMLLRNGHSYSHLSINRRYGDPWWQIDGDDYDYDYDY